MTNRTDRTAPALRTVRATDATSPAPASRLASVATMSCCRPASLLFRRGTANLNRFPPLKFSHLQDDRKRRLWEGAVRGVAGQSADALVPDRRCLRADGGQGKTHPPDISDLLPLELKDKAWRTIDTRRLIQRASTTRTRRSRSGCRTGTLSSVPRDATGPQDTLGDLPRIPRVLPQSRLHGDLPADDHQDAVRRRVDAVQAAAHQRPRVLDAELAAAPRERHRGSVRRSACCRAPARSRAGRSTMRSTSLEAGLLFISFDDPLNHTEGIVCTVVDNTLEAWLQDPQDEPVV